MIAINIEKLKMATARLQQVRKKVSDTADGIYRQKIFWLAEQAILVSPQFSGDFASNWALAIDGDMPVYRQWADKVSGSVVPVHNDNGTTSYRIHQAGDPEAVASSKARIAAQLRGVTRASRIHLVNATELEVGAGGATMIGPDGTERLRPENVIPGHVRIEAYVRAQAASIPKEKVKL